MGRSGRVFCVARKRDVKNFSPIRAFVIIFFARGEPDIISSATNLICP